jgi:hypothetical protein
MKQGERVGSSTHYVEPEPGGLLAGGCPQRQREEIPARELEKGIL